jgi:hypothetical protein
MREANWMLSAQFILAHQLAASFAALPQVEAVVLGGSLSSGTADAASDIDLYVYTRAEIPLESRRRLVQNSGGAQKANLGMTFWGQSDEWIQAGSGIEVDAIYFDTAWIEDQIRQVVEAHQASLGYTTSLWRIVQRSLALSDPHGWFAGLQAACNLDYPDALRRNILALNQPILRDVIPSYFHQIEKAVRRGDLVSVNHRLAALLASYFDILFALNRELHPGEKRLAEHAARLPKQPDDLSADLAGVLRAAAIADDRLIHALTHLLDQLDLLLDREGFNAANGLPRAV